MTDQQPVAVPFMQPCRCGNVGIQIQWFDADDSSASELVVYAHCDHCGANGPVVQTDTGRRNPLGHAEAEAIRLWNQHRSCTLGQALELPQIQLLFQKLQYFRNKLSGDNLDYILDATYLECEQAYNQVIKRDPA
jgi:hypothetical protein